MSVKIAINGFGRVGRYITRILAAEERNIECVAISSRADSATLAHLLEYDSVHGHFNLPVEYEEDALIINGKRMAISRGIEDISDLPWGKMGVDIALEVSGQFRDRESCAKHLAAGAKKVILGAPGKGVDVMLVLGVNEESYDPENHHVISNASCTTNCLTPVVKIIHQEFGIKRGLMTTIHSYTMDQRLLDGSHEDLRRARAATMSMVPTTSGAARAVGEVMPELAGRMDGLAIRVPTPNVSLVDLTCELEKETTAEEVNAALKAASENGLKGILQYSDIPLVSIDYTSSPYSAILDAPLTNMIDGKMLKVMVWYDNESGFSNRMVDLVNYIGSKL